MKIVIPLFLGYLGSAAQFVFAPKKAQVAPVLEYLGILTYGPIMVFSLGLTSVLFAFGYSNRIDAPPATGMSVDDLSNILTAALGLLAVTTNVLVSYLFAVEGKQTS